MKKLKYTLEVNKILNFDNMDMTLEEFKYFNTKKEAINYAQEHDYLNGTYYYTKLWNRNDYIILTE